MLHYLLQTQFIDNINGVVEVPHTFDTGKPIRTVCLFCKDQSLNEAALAAGADAAVGLEGLKMFQVMIWIEEVDVHLFETPLLLLVNFLLFSGGCIRF